MKSGQRRILLQTVSVCSLWLAATVSDVYANSEAIESQNLNILAENSALYNAIRNNDISVLDQILSDVDSATLAHESGRHPLLFAAELGSYSVMSSFLKAGADSNTLNQHGQTALHLATIHNDVALINLLRGHGADISIKDQSGKTALDYAIDHNFIQVARAIDESAVTVEYSEAGLPVVALVAASGGFSTTTAVVAGVGAVGAGAAAVAAGGGGGGGDAAPSGIPVSTPPPVAKNNPPSSPSPSPSSPSNNVITEAQEGANQWGLSAINAQTAYNLGATGEGVIVAVLDTGVDINHPELRDNILRDKTGKVVGDSDHGVHGTIVAGFIAAAQNFKGFHGVAPDAKILSYAALDDRDGPDEIEPVGISNETIAGMTATVVNFDAAIDFVAGEGAQVFNNSWGFIDPASGVSIPITGNEGAGSLSAANMQTVFSGLASHDRLNSKKANHVLMVFAAGNGAPRFDNQGQPVRNIIGSIINLGMNEVGVVAGLPHVFPELEETWLAVVAVDRNNNIASFSNRCGVAKDWCLAAPGVGLRAVNPEDFEDAVPGLSEYPEAEIFQGTSFAAPHVSGAAALLLSYWENITPAVAREILLESADRSFAGYDIEVHGQGMLDLTAAFNPRGNLRVPTSHITQASQVNSAGVDLLSASQLTLGAAAGDSLARAQLSVGYFDRYDRYFSANIEHTLPSKDVSERFFDFGEAPFEQEISVNDRTKLAMSAEKTMDENSRNTPENIASFERLTRDDGDDEYKETRFSLTSDYNDWSVQLNYNVDLDQALGFGTMSVEDTSLFMSDSAVKNGFLAFAKDGVSSMMSLDYDKETTLSFAAYSGQTDTQNQRVMGMVSDVTHLVNDRLKLGGQFGYMHEQGTFLGSYTSGAFSTREGTPTWHASVSASYDVTQDSSVFAHYSHGVSIAEAADASLIKSVSAIQSQSFGAGMISDDWFTKQDQLGLSVSGPLRIKSGHASVDMLTGRDRPGNLLFERVPVNLSPSGQEIDIEGFYKADVGDDMEIKAGALYRHEPGHVAGADGETVLLMKFSYEM